MKGMPDAWRFDPDGCAAGGFKTPETSAGTNCAFLGGVNFIGVSRAEYIEQTGQEKFAYANFHDATAVNLSKRFTIAQFRFDQSAAFDGLGLRPDSCGCLEQPLCLHLTSATWTGADGIERSFLIQQEFLNWEDPSGSVGCPIACDLCPDIPPPAPNPCANQQPTAARSRTWGSLKAGYR
jgi:hypothetical protein